MMTSDDFLTGKLVRLVPFDIETDSKLLAEWSRDSEYLRLLDSENATRYSAKQTQDFFEKEISSMHLFMIQRLDDDRKIGEIDLAGFNWLVGNAWVGIGIGERALWGKGYGTDAMRIILRYAFTELNLNRVSLNVFEVNPRAVASYIKAGFREEGRAPKSLLIAGRRCDLIFMGILRSEWESLQLRAN
jgi:RimJ/RimL family protein N-acetyltransferase